MSTLFWLPSSGTADVSPTPAGGTWTLHSSGRPSRPLLLTNSGGTALTTEAYTPDAADHLVAGSALHSQYVSKILPPQTIPVQVVKFSAVGLEAVATNNLFMRWQVTAVSADGTSTLATIVIVQNDGTEWLTTVAGRTDFTSASTLATLTQPFRIVLEIGANGTPTASAGIDGHNFSISVGEGSSGHDFPQDTDATVLSAPPYLLFSTTLNTKFH